jgi:phosphatidylinositol alpha-1,6-mannosyltransferase
MLCRNRWGGLEQEGFGIVFLEAAACEVPQVAGDSGGAEDAVIDGVTGVMVRHADDAHRGPDEAARAFEKLLDDPTLRRTMGRAGRLRAVDQFSYDGLAKQLGIALGALP